MAELLCQPRGTRTSLLLRSEPAAEALIPRKTFACSAQSTSGLPAATCRPQIHQLNADQARQFGRSLRPNRHGSRHHPTAVRAQSVSSPVQSVEEDLVTWLTDKGFPEQPVEIRDAGPLGRGCFARRPIGAGEVALSVPENFTVSAVDVASHPVIATAAQGRDDLVGLTLWLLYERSLGQASVWHPYLRTLPESTMSPLLWSPAELDELLQGSPVLAEVRERAAVLESEYETIRASYLDAAPKVFPPEAFSLEAFKRAFAVVLSRVIYLPAVDIVALVPFADMFNHQSGGRAVLDYRLEENTISLVADQSYPAGDQVWASYGPDRTNTDLFISYGFVPAKNAANFLDLTVGLLPTDRLYGMKKQILEEEGFQAQQAFPVFEDRLPTQMLTYVRLARLQDPALFAKVAFERDALVTQSIEYEVLMLLIGECRDRLAAYKGSYEEDLQLLNRKTLKPKERVAAQLRLSEKRILNAAMGALRNRLAPIRGVPTKGGQMQDPNSDIKEMFEVMEAGLSAPRKLLSGLFGKPKE